MLNLDSACPSDLKPLFEGFVRIIIIILLAHNEQAREGARAQPAQFVFTGL
jgi:hypothetical protein